MEIDKATAFLRENPRAVLATRRSDGRPQLSPVTAGVDGDGRVVVSTRETAMKAKNIARCPDVTLCVFTDHFFGPWVYLDGTAELVHLPEAMDGLVDYYRSVSGEHPDWDDYRAAMERDRRVLVRISVSNAGPDRSG